jgi:hypothetical protein
MTCKNRNLMAFAIIVAIPISLDMFNANKLEDGVG